MIDGRRGQNEEEASAEGSHVEPPAPKHKGPGLGARLHRAGVTADQITCLGLALAALTAVLIGAGQLLIGVALITIGGLMDFLDGSVAKAAGSSSKRGAFFDSTTDRVADGLIFGGVAWYFAAGHHPKLALLPFAIFGAGTVVSYSRAKAESLGFVGKGGLMERAERLILLGVALAFHWVLVPLLWLLLGLTLLTAVQRFAKVWVQATAEMRGEATGPKTAASIWRTGKVESRWRAWREASRSGAAPGAAARRARTPASRWRARRHDEPLATRVRRVLEAERLGPRGARDRRAPRSKPVRPTRTANGRQRYGDRS